MDICSSGVRREIKMIHVTMKHLRALSIIVHILSVYLINKSHALMLDIHNGMNDFQVGFNVDLIFKYLDICQ